MTDYFLPPSTQRPLRKLVKLLNSCHSPVTNHHIISAFRLLEADVTISAVSFFIPVAVFREQTGELGVQSQWLLGFRPQ